MKVGLRAAERLVWMGQGRAVKQVSRRVGCFLLLSLALGTTLEGGISGCNTGQDEQGKAVEKIFVEDLDLERSEGRYRLEFTMVNGYHLPVTAVDLLLTYSDYDGKAAGTFKVKLPGHLEAHDAVRKMGVDGGPLITGGEKVKVEITRARTTLVRKK